MPIAIHESARIFPIIQNWIDCVFDVSATTVTKKLTAAEQAALSAKPARSSVNPSPLPLIEEIKRIRRETSPAPRKAAAPIPSKLPIIPIPSAIASTAPRLAPEEIPNRYGSASGFFITACITAPQTASPAPMKKESTRCGRRMNCTTSCPTIPFPSGEVSARYR